MVEQVAMRVIANDYVVCEVIRRGRLELNAFLPLLSHSLFESISLLEEADRIFTEKCILGIEANEEVCQEYIEKSWKEWGLTALVPYIGYKKATEIGCQAKQEGKTAREVIISQGTFSEEELDKILRENITAFEKGK
jgi:aspartate ammonia-lyase